MALSDEDVDKQIQHMIAFIEQEACEKVEEIDTKAEEEYNIEKGKIVTEQRLKIKDYYDKKEKSVELERQIQDSSMVSRARLDLLKLRNDRIADVLEEAHEKLKEEVADPGRYSEVLRALILQGLYQLIEKKVLLRCRKKDVDMVEGMLDSISIQYNNDVGKTCKVCIDNERFLPDESTGGIMLWTPNEKIRIDNTLENRMDMISQQVLPEIRETLFGASEGRKFRC